MCRGVDSGEGSFHPQPTSENFVNSPSGIWGRELTETEFGYSTAVLYWRQLCSTTRLATTNRSCVSIRVAKLFGHGRWHGQPCNNFCLLGYSLIMQNLVTVSHIVCAQLCMSLEIFRTLDTSCLRWGMSD